MMSMVFSKPDESAGTKHRRVSLRPITGVVNGTRPAICLERVYANALKAKTDQAGEVVGYEAPDERRNQPLVGWIKLLYFIGGNYGKSNHIEIYGRIITEDGKYEWGNEKKDSVILPLEEAREIQKMIAFETLLTKI